MVLEEGAQMTASATPPIGSPALGHVTSSYRSATLGPLDRAGARRGGPVADRVESCIVPMPKGAIRGHGHGADLLRQAGSAPPCLTSVLAPRVRRSKALALPAGDKFALAEAPAAARFVFRGGETARAACSAAFWADLPAELGPAGEGKRRAALWLGPDEWLLIAEGDGRGFARRGARGGARHGAA